MRCCVILFDLSQMQHNEVTNEQTRYIHLPWKSRALHTINNNKAKADQKQAKVESVQALNDAIAFGFFWYFSDCISFYTVSMSVSLSIHR